MLIQAKLEPPHLPERFIPRPRLDALIGDLLDHTAVVWVCASAGAGKTTAVLHALRERSEPVGWLSLDNTDSAPGRLLTYLEAALLRACPGLDAAGSEALASGAPHPEAAGLLAEAIGDRPVVLVLDQIERIATHKDAMTVIDAFLRYAPRSLRAVLISRREILLDIASRNWQSTARVSEADLAFTVPETEQALGQSGSRHPAADAAVAATGGWVTGVLFEAWRSSEHVYGAGGEADPLHGYLSTQILAELSDEDRRFLIATAVLSDVTAERAEALGVDDASARLASLKQAHIPATWRTDQSLRCHPRFREYLLELLDRQSDGFTESIRRSHAELLSEEGHFEEATERLLDLGDLEQTVETAEKAIFGVVERLDLAVAERWISALANGPGEHSRVLAWAELAVAIGLERFGRAAGVADRLRALMAPDEIIDPELAAMMAWSYWFVERYDDHFAILARAGPGPAPAMLKWASSVEMIDGHGSYHDEPPAYGGVLDALPPRVHWTHGRLDRLLDPQATRWAEAINRPWKIMALTTLGRHKEALRLSDEASSAGWSHNVHYDAIAKIELLAEVGRPAEAWRAHIEGRERVSATGSGFFYCLHLLLEAKLALRLSRNADQARAALERLSRFPAAKRVQHVLDEYATWNGLTCLMEKRDQEGADLLRATAARLRERDRLLHLPSVAVYLAEAEWRLSNEQASDAAADLALTASERLGSNHSLLCALADFPAVAARRIDAEPEADSPWQAIGRSLLRRGIVVSTASTTRVHLHDLGKPFLEFGGETHRPRISKSIELLSYLLNQPQERASRQDILGALFAGRTDGSSRSYLRQAIARLRETLPDKGLVEATSDEVRLTTPTISSDSARLRTILAQSVNSDDEDVSVLAEALELAARGEFLQGHSSIWVDEIRRDLAGMLADARLTFAERLFARGDYGAAQTLSAELLASDPLRESAWRMSMRISNALGDDDDVISSYNRCKIALAEIGLQPAESTRRLIDQLRR